jgi:hypothetical protein
MGKSEIHTSLLVGRGRRRWEDNINTDIKEMAYVNSNWIYLEQDNDPMRSSYVYLRLP